MDGVASAAEWKEFAVAIKGVDDGGMVDECIVDGKKLTGEACKKAFLHWYVTAHTGHAEAFTPADLNFPSLSPQTRERFLARCQLVALRGGFKAAAAFDGLNKTSLASYGKCCLALSPPR